MAAPDAPPFRTLTASVEGRTGRLVLSQPERLNAIGALALQELVDAAAWFDERPVDVVVVSGAGRAFCAGFDRRELAGAPATGPTGADRVATPALGAEMAAAISSMRALTVAQLHGPVVGGGFVLALCCDLRVAADDAWFSLPEAELGIPLAWSGVPRLVRELGPGRTAELVLTCRRVPAPEALALGLLTSTVPAAELEATVAALVGSLLERPSEVIAATKRQVEAAAEALVPTTGAWAGTDELIAALRRLLA
jgi:enoyl-CoA hydratase/carnithine racemase